MCEFVKEKCTSVETVNFFKLRYCYIGGEGERGVIPFYIILVRPYYPTLNFLILK